MPHVNSSGGDDLASTDEVKVYKDEGDEEKRSSENLSEDKLGLVTESEEGKSSDIEGRSFGDDKASSAHSQDGKLPENPMFPGADRLGGFGYPPMITPYPYPNGANLGPFGSKVLPSPPPGLAPFYMYPPNDHFSPPPAHMGIPPVHIDPKTGLPRPMYGIPPHPGQAPLLYPEISQWPGPPGYPISAAGLRASYHSSLNSSPLSRFSPPGIIPPGLPHLPPPAIVTPGPKQEITGLLNGDSHRPNTLQGVPDNRDINSNPPPEKKKPYIRKPLNAFMLFMKEERQKVIEECTLKESAAINQILGRKWHALDRSEQAKYYEMARKEKELHQQLYPGWSARDNYASHAKKKKRKREVSNGENRGYKDGENESWEDDCANAKKCRARFGLDQQTQWCKPCRRKKKCIRFLEDGGVNSHGEDEDDDDDDDDTMIHSVGTVHSTTEAESELGSPTSTTQHDDNSRVTAQPRRAPSPASKVSEIDVVGNNNNNNSNNNNNNAVISSVCPVPPVLHHPVAVHSATSVSSSVSSSPLIRPTPDLTTPSASVSSSTMVLAS